MYLLRKKINHKSFRVVFLAATLVETLVQNCGVRFHQALACEKFMNAMKDVVKVMIGAVPLRPGVTMHTCATSLALPRSTAPCITASTVWVCVHRTRASLVSTEPAACLRQRRQLSSFVGPSS